MKALVLLLSTLLPAAPPADGEEPQIEKALANVLKEMDNEFWMSILPALGRTPSNQELAAGALGKMGPPAKAALPALAKLLEHDDPRVRKAAAEAMVQIGQADETRSAIVEVLEHKDNDIRRQALGTIDPKAREIGPFLEDMLKDESPDLRKVVIRALVRIGPDDKAIIVPFLTNLLEDERPYVRRAAILVLIRLGPDDEAISALAKAVEREGQQVRGEVFFWLFAGTQPGGYREERVLRRLFEHSGLDVLKSVIRAMAKIGPSPDWATRTFKALAQDADANISEAAITSYFEDSASDLRKAVIAAWYRSKLHANGVAAVRTMCHDEDPNARRAAVAALGALGPDPDNARAVTDLLDDEDPDVRQAAVSALCKIELDAEGVRAVIDLLDDEDLRVQLTAAGVMGGVARVVPEAKAAIPALIGLLGSSNRFVRARAAYSLGCMGPAAAAAVPTLTKLIDDYSRDVRIAAVTALGWIGPDAKAATPALVKLLEDSNCQIPVGAMGALFQIEPAARETIPAVAKVFEQMSPGMLEVATRELRRTKLHAEAVPALAQTLENTDSVFREVAVNKLSAMGPEARAAVPALARQLRDEEPRVRRNVLAALVQIGLDGRAIPAVVRMLEDEDPSLRRAACSALAETGPEAKVAIPALTKLLADEEPDVCVAAAEALGKLGTESTAAIPALEKLTRHADRGIRWTAAEALIRIGPEGIAVFESLIQHEKELLSKAAVEVMDVVAAAEAQGKIAPEKRELVAEAKRWFQQEHVDGGGDLGNAQIYVVLCLCSTVPEAATAAAKLRSLLIGSSVPMFKPGDATSALGALGPKAIPTLVKLLDYQHCTVYNLPKYYAELRPSAAEALAEIGPESVPALIGLIEGADRPE